MSLWILPVIPGTWNTHYKYSYRHIQNTLINTCCKSLKYYGHIIVHYQECLFTRPLNFFQDNFCLIPLVISLSCTPFFLWSSRQWNYISEKQKRECINQWVSWYDVESDICVYSIYMFMESTCIWLSTLEYETIL